MTKSGRIDVIHSFANPLKGCRCTNSEIGHTHIVVDRADESYNLQMGMSCGLFFSYFACELEVTSTVILNANQLTLASELGYEARPLCAKDICAGERTISTTDNECVDAFFNHVEGGGETTFMSSKRGRAGGANQSASLPSVSWQNDQRVKRISPLQTKLGHRPNLRVRYTDL